MCATAAGAHTDLACVCGHLQVLRCDVQRVFRLSHVKHLILHILNVQLWVQPTVDPHLVDLPEEGVHICLQHSFKSGSEFELQLHSDQARSPARGTVIAHARKHSFASCKEGHGVLAEACHQSATGQHLCLTFSNMLVSVACCVNASVEKRQYYTCQQ